MTASTTHPEAAQTDASVGGAGARPIRVVMQQPALPKYRVPVFRELASRPGIEYKLVFGEYPGLPNVEPEGFAGEKKPLRMFRILGQEFLWHAGQWSNASRAKADVLILSWNTRYLSLIPTLVRARLAGVRTILWGHGASKRRGGWRVKIMHALTGLAHAVVFYNTIHARRFIEAGFDEKRVFVALNSLDQSAIQAARSAWLDAPGRLDAFREAQGFRGPVVLFVSRFDRDNRIDLLVEAAKELCRERDDLRVVLVGKGEDEERLRSMIREKGLEGRVLMPGAIYNELDLAPYFLSASVFCYPRNIGLSLLHAFGYGVPVVTGDNLASHNPEIEALRPGENGLFYKDLDAGDLARALREVIGDAPRRERMAAEAHRTIREVFCMPRMVDGFEKAIRYVMRSR